MQHRELEIIIVAKADIVRTHSMMTGALVRITAIIIVTATPIAAAVALNLIPEQGPWQNLA
jgi:hypothetical protein